MLAQQLTSLTGPDGLEPADLPVPEGGTGEVLVDVAAAGVAYPDLLMSTGAYQVRHPLPLVLGLEAAGTVRSAPAGSGFAPGQRVAVLGERGTWQQVVAAPSERVLPLPDGISDDAAAGFPLNHLTCWFALRRRARVETGESVLVHGASGGVGQAALALCRALGLPSIAIVRDPGRPLPVPADHVVGADGWREAVRELTDGRGVDVVLDPVGGERFPDTLRSLAPEGRVVVLGFVGGDIPTVRVNRLLLANTAVLGAGLAEYLRCDPGYARTAWDELRSLLEGGRLVVTEPRVRPLAEAADALRELGEGRAAAKTVLRLP
ncbi:NADPH:quinone oxidoreductase family protein [Geodermatophilus sabuli]|uniref:NADPH:quinone oxidoreductase family protein n=1 Tax=Geodermatophilus sabuli TaxID=1564158 RepID=UPI0031F3074D